jgi:hypothetical protein
MAMAVALFAITLNFLQPLAHAALLRDGAPEALWNVFCNAAAADPDGKSGSVPMAAQHHECCLGLAHAATVAPPPTAFVLVAPAAAVTAPPLLSEQPTPVGIRDGPSQPRGPPILV